MVASLLLFGASLLPSHAKQPAEEFARVMFGHLRAGISECPQDLPIDLAGRSTICATYNSSFGYFKSQWESNLERHDLPRRVKWISHWTLSDGRYESEFTVGDHKLSVVFEEKRGLLIAVFDPGDDSDSDALEDAAPSQPKTVLMAGFGGVTIPQPISKVEPVYPEKAKRNPTAGSVTLSITVNEDGSVSDAAVLSSRPEGRGFGESALEAVKQWTYEPATLDGKPVSVRHTVIVELAPPP